MDKEMQDLAWRCLPTEVKMEIKAEYHRTSIMYVKGQYELGILHTYESTFGIDNLTSDAEGEEMLIVPRSKVIEIYNPEYDGETLYELFGSKCLADEGTVSAESQPVTDCNRSAENVQKSAENAHLRANGADHFDTISHRGFEDHNRLHIAAMAMAGLLANEGVSCFTDVQELEQMDFITYHAFEYADKLIKKMEEDEKLAEL